MKFGLGSFETAFPGRTKSGTIDDLYRETLAEVGRARVFCPFPPGSNIQDEALIVARRMPIRWFVSKHSVVVYDLEHPVAEGWLQQQRSSFGWRSNPMTHQEEEDFLDSLSADDTAWQYTYSTSSGDVNQVLRRLARNPPSTAEKLAAVIAAAVWNGETSSTYIRTLDVVPDCPTVPARTILPGGPTTQRWAAVKRHYGRR
jgi:hypothetical protein